MYATSRQEPQSGRPCTALNDSLFQIHSMTLLRLLPQSKFPRSHVKSRSTRTIIFPPAADKKPAETPAASVSSPAARGLFYSFQLGRFATEADAQPTYTRIKDLPDARIERIGKAYTARFGLWQNRADAVEFRAATKKIAPAVQPESSP